MLGTLQNVSSLVGFSVLEKGIRDGPLNANHTAASTHRIDILRVNLFIIDFDATSFFNIALKLLHRISCPKSREPR